VKSSYNFLGQPTPHLIAHRGGNILGMAKQNTLAAFQSAADIGYRYIETDVLLTKDNKVIIYHGSRNRRQQHKTSQYKRKTIQGMTYSQIKRTIKPGGEEVPLLSDALAAFPKMLFNIDAKTKEVVKPLAQTIKQAKATDRVCIASFGYKRTLGVAELLGGQQRVCTSIGPGGFSAYYLHTRLRQKLLESKIDSMGVGCLQLPHRFVSSRLIEVAHRRQKMVHAWTVNTQRTMFRMLEVGVDGIVTDEAQLLKDVVKRSKNNN